MSNGLLQPRPGNASPSLPFEQNELFETGPNEDWRHCFPEIIGRSSAMCKMLQFVHKVARTDSAVLISGESGTGKELVASAIHRLSQRSARHFVALNCSAIPETLIEAELFGHERGAFTGADKKRVGHFEMANGGTIFLDEIGDMPLSLQAKILRVLQEKQYTPLGSSHLHTTNARIIAATNVELRQAVHAKTFRQDLYYRLNVLPVYMPALRERKGDVEPLINYFLDLANTKHALTKPCYLQSEVIEILTGYSWPGNVRELQNLVERLVVISGGGVIKPSDLPKEYLHSEAPIIVTSSQQPTEDPDVDDELLASLAASVKASEGSGEFGKLTEEGVDLTSMIENLENTYILQALKMTNNNKNQAAKLLGLNRTTLVERIKKRRLAPLNSPSKEL